MRTRTRKIPNQKPQSSKEIFKEISEKVDERGFYLYEWISPDELKQSVKADYLSIVQKSSIPLAIITVIAGFMGVLWGIAGIFWSILTVLGIFYGIVALILIAKMFYRSYLYSRWANVVITDDHYISWGNIFHKKDSQRYQEEFDEMGQIFREPLFEESQMQEYVNLKKASLTEQLKTIAKWWNSLIEQINKRSSSRSNDSSILVLVILASGFLYAAMMGFVYFAWVWLVAIIAQGFAWISHRILLATHNKEHVIQSLFHEIMHSSIGLKAEKKAAVVFLNEAEKNEWTGNLSGRINKTLEKIDSFADTSTEKSIKLRKEIEDSKYQEIFNFPKYDNWIRAQILTPIDELIDLINKNKIRITAAIQNIDEQTYKKIGDNFWGSSGTKVLEAQKKRFEVQLESFDRMLVMLQNYKNKLS